MGYDKRMEHQREKEEDYAESLQKTRDDWVWSKMQKGEEFYPFSAAHIIEAFAESSYEQACLLQTLLEYEGNPDLKAADTESFVKNICRSYWERIARYQSEIKVSAPDED